jgi:ElaB/YqjD/DUF883 family membrane-anchored ribosome-binding protein
MTTENSRAHEVLAWGKQRIDELDAVISKLEISAEKLKETTRKDADAALDKLKAARARLRSAVDELRSDVAVTKQRVEEIGNVIEGEWIEVESIFQTYLETGKAYVEEVRELVLARVQVQRQAWEASYQDLRARATDAAEKSRAEFDAAVERLSGELEKIKEKFGEVKEIREESWEAVKKEFVDIKAVHERAIQKVKDAFSGLR